LRPKAVGDGWLFPQRRRDEPWPREVFGQLFDRSEEKAGVPKLKGGRWHAYRRKWATERKKLSVVDVMAAGGWKDLQTLLTCYQHSDEETMIEVMASPVKLRDRRASSSRCETLAETLALGEKQRSPTLRIAVSGFELPLLGSSRRRPSGVNQDSPDPEGPLEHPEFQQVATIYASSCHPLLEFDGFMLDFAVLYSLKCRSWSGAPLDLPRNVKHLVRTEHTVSLRNVILAASFRAASSSRKAL